MKALKGCLGTVLLCFPVFILAMISGCDLITSLKLFGSILVIVVCIIVAMKLFEDV